MTDAFSSLHLSVCNYRWNPLPPTSSGRKCSLCTLCTAPQIAWVHLSKQLSVNSVPAARKWNVSQLWSRCLRDKAMDTQIKNTWAWPQHWTAQHSSPVTWTSSYILWIGNPTSVWKHWVDVPLYIIFFVSRDLLDNLVPCYLHVYSLFLPIQFIFLQQCIIYPQPNVSLQNTTSGLWVLLSLRIVKKEKHLGRQSVWFEECVKSNLLF